MAANPAESQVLPRSWLGSFEELVDETIEFFARCSHHFMVGMGWRVAQKYEEYLASENLPEEDQPDEGYEEATDLIEIYDDYESDPVFEDEEFVRQGTSSDRDYTAISFQHHGVEEDELNLPAFEEENRAYFTIVSGHSQLGIINTELADPVVFGLQTTAGRPLEGITVKISPKDSTAIWTGTTDAAGQVSYIWSASETTPVQRLEISVNHPTWRVSPLEAAAIIFDCEDERSFTGAYDTSTAPYNMYGSDYGAVAISFEDLRANDPPNFEEWAPTSHEFGGGITDIFAPGGGFYGYGVSVSGLDYVLPEAGIHQPLHNVLDWELFPYFYAENIFTYTPQKPFPQDGFPLPIHVVVNLGFTSLKTYHQSGEVFIECSLSPMYIWTEHPDLSPFVTYLVPDGLYKQSHRDTVTGTVMPHFEFTLSGGKLNGEYKEYSTNPDEAGTVVWSCPYVDNVAHGQFVGYHSDGSVAGYGPYDNGKRHGDWYYYNSLGVITAHEVWNQDVLVSSN